MYENDYPKVGIGLLVIKGDKILLGQRVGSHGENEFGGPGGHLEYMETIEDSILRELAEEAGPDFKVKNLRYLCTTNLMKYAPKHYIDIGMVAEWESGDPVVMEPEKRKSWNWHNVDQPPGALFGCMENYFEAYRTGKSYFSKT